MEQSSEETALGLRPRLFAAAVFAITAVLPVILFFYTVGRSGALFQGPSETPNVFMIWFFGIVPICAAAFCGFTIGARLADPSERTTDLRAAGRGIVVALLSYVIFMAIWIGSAFVDNVLMDPYPYSHQSFSGLLGWFVVIFIFGLVLTGWLIVGAGAFAGLLLKYITTRFRFSQRWNTSGRISASQARRWNGLVGLLFISIHLIYVLMVIFKAPGANGK
jgi:hypothetical protein